MKILQHQVQKDSICSLKLKFKHALKESDAYFSFKSNITGRVFIINLLNMKIENL